VILFITLYLTIFIDSFSFSSLNYRNVGMRCQFGGEVIVRHSRILTVYRNARVTCSSALAAYADISFTVDADCNVGVPELFSDVLQ